MASAILPYSISVSGFLKGALTLTTALAWNTAVKDVINHVYKRPQDNVRAQIAYAVTITIMVIIVILLYNNVANSTTLNAFAVNSRQNNNLFGKFVRSFDKAREKWDQNNFKHEYRTDFILPEHVNR